MAQVSLRIDLASSGRIGPGAIRLLELVDETGSISAAGRAYGMTYRQAWTVLDDLSRIFRWPILEAQPGGRHGGGARLTAFGHEVARRYRELESATDELARRHLDALEAAAHPAGPKGAASG
jgi:molybdate transport system regulatory protein